ncbi:MAG: hypothetical protein V3V81_08055 [Candidatus Bathyarchaeia archaeon]
MVGFDTTKIQWEKVKNPSPMFKLFEPSKEKFAIISKHLMDGFLNLSDDQRTATAIFRLMGSYFYNPNNLIYEINEMEGLLGFTSIVPSWKCDLLFKIFDKKLWKPSFVKEAGKLVKFIMKEFELRRISAETPDFRVCRMAKLISFKEEGFKKDGFVFNNEFYDKYLLGILNHQPEKSGKEE